MMYRKKFCVLFAALILSIACAFNQIYADDVLPDDEYEVDLTYETFQTQDESMVLNARSAIAIEASTGRILFSKNPYEKKAIASTTKIVTAILAIEYGKFDEVVTVSQKAAYTQGSTIKLSVGEKIKVIDLIYGLMLCSGNDAAVALAEHIAGSEEKFVEMMNKKAEQLGATNTHFVTPHGLDDDDHYSTAYDMAIITAECMKNETFRTVVSTAETYISGRSLRNTNDLLFTYQGATGVKTGFTGNAGRCLVASAERDGMEIITVVLGCDDKKSRFADSRKLLDYSFDKYSMKELLKEDQIITEIDVIKGKQGKVKLLCTDDVTLPMSEDEKIDYEIKISAPERINAPCAGNNLIGKLYITCKDENIAVCDLKIAESIDKKSFGDFWKEIVGIWASIF